MATNLLFPGLFLLEAVKVLELTILLCTLGRFFLHRSHPFTAPGHHGPTVLVFFAVQRQPPGFVPGLFVVESAQLGVYQLL